jgi:hypothetical protein
MKIIKTDRKFPHRKNILRISNLNVRKMSSDRHNKKGTYEVFIVIF